MVYVCHCNPFGDGDARRFLQEKGAESTVREVYHHCTGGKKPECMTCVPKLKGMVDEHNAGFPDGRKSGGRQRQGPPAPSAP